MVLNFCKNGLVYLILSKTLHLYISVSLPVIWIKKKLGKVVNAADSFFFQCRVKRKMEHLVKNCLMVDPSSAKI